MLQIIDTFVTSGMIVHIGLLPKSPFLEPMNLKQGDNMLTSVVVQQLCMYWVFLSHRIATMNSVFIAELSKNAEHGTIATCEAQQAMYNEFVDFKTACGWSSYIQAQLYIHQTYAGKSICNQIYSKLSV